jgi:hypothetical protein
MPSSTYHTLFAITTSRRSSSLIEDGERVIFGPDIVTEAEEKVKQIQENILAAQSRQKSYADK